MRFENKQYDEERALYGLDGAEVKGCRFDGPADGESALKECSNIRVQDCFFNLRYPFWHVKNAGIRNCEMTENCRAALWYDEGVSFDGCKLHGIKALRECSGITLKNSDVISAEFFWKCRDIAVSGVSLQSEYPFLECRNAVIDDLTMKAKYSFQYTENITITRSKLDTKDAFWHSKNVTVTDSVVKGEYLGWYSENLKLVRCHIIGTQPLCYCKGLILEDCTMEAADLAFERSEVRASVKGCIVSVKNPLCGSIKADEIGTLIEEAQFIDPAKTEIICGKIGEKQLS